MVQAITATYVQEDDDWTITVAGQGKELNGRAPGIIAARDRADQLVEKLVAEGEGSTVVHLLNGSALEFTTAYITARLARPEPAAPEAGTETETETEPEVAAAPEAEAATSATSATSEQADAEAPQAEDEESTPQAKPVVPRKELSKDPAEAEQVPTARSAEDEHQPKGEAADMATASGARQAATG
ncbi:hypothetical protein [Qaidamihabitans albus]|uniref:hypothetical protein n=1 Tax=Qaidamihabitans albus TaxID=2795733 RepID=UPI0027DD1BF3|nr:hypothetical protein [Qaidamihabitans albus]